jgi:hypothetical protein
LHISAAERSALKHYLGESVTTSHEAEPADH